MQGSSKVISCEAEGFPHPLVTLSRITDNRRHELNRGIKIASLNLTNIHQDKEAGHYVCEAVNDGGRLEKEFKISIHGQCLITAWSSVLSFESVASSTFSLRLEVPACF